MTQNKKQSNGYAVTTVIIFAICIYLLCTSFICMTYKGVYVDTDKATSYTMYDGKIECDAIALKGIEVLAGVSFEVVSDTDLATITLENAMNKPSDCILKLSVNPETDNETGITSVIFTGNLAETGAIKKGYTVQITVETKLKNTDSFSGSFTFDNNVLKPVYLYDNNQSIQLEFSAFELLFGSQSNAYFHFGGHIWALLLWLPPIIGALAAVIFKKGNAGNVIGMVCSIVGVLAIAYLIGGARLTISSTASIVLYMLTFVLCVLSVFKKLQANKPSASNNVSDNEESSTDSE